MYPSKQKVSCSFCEWVGRKDKAKEHWRKKHPEETFKLKVSENNLTKYNFRKETTEGTRIITSGDADGDGDNNDDNKFEEQQQENVIILSPDDSTTSTSKTVISPSLSALGTPSVASTPSFASTSSNPSASSTPAKDFKSPTFIHDQLILITKQLSKITNAIDHITVENPSKESSSSFTEASDMDRLFDSIKCSNDLFMLRGLEINNQLDIITCAPCSAMKKHAPKHLLTSIKSSFGVFQHIEQKVDEPLSQRFRSLKSNLKLHFSNKLHIWCVREQEERQQAFEDFLKKNEKAGLNVGRAALFCIRSGLGGLKFVDTLNLLDLSGAAVGTYR